MSGGMIPKLNNNRGELLIRSSAEGHKQLMRESCIEIAEALEADYVEQASAEITDRFLSLPEYSEARTIFCYMSFGNEPVTDAIIERALADGKTVCIPLCRGKGIMTAKKYAEGDELNAGAFGIREPLETAEDVAPEDIDLAVIPALACDRNCNRIGHGAGYYDRYLAGETDGDRDLNDTIGKKPEIEPRYEMLKIALCFDKLIMGTIPIYRNDIKMDKVVTESAVYVASVDGTKVTHSGAR